MAMNAMTVFGQRECCNLTLVDYATDKPILYIDYANANSTDLTAETVYAYGGFGHPRRVGFTSERGGTMTLETQLACWQLYSIMTGAALENAAKFIQREKIVASEDGMLTVTDTPVDGVVNVFSAADDCGTELSGTYAEGMFECESIKSGEAYIVYYMKEFTNGVQKLSVNNTSLPKAVKIYAETLGKTENEETIGMKMIAHKAQPESNATWNFSNTGDPTTLTVNFELMADSEGNILTMAAIEE